MGRELSLSRQEREKASQKSTERELAASSLRTFSLLHLALSKKKTGLFSVYISLWEMGEKKARDRIKNQTCRHESDDLFSLHLCICLRKPLLRAWNGESTKKKRKKRDKKRRRRSAVGCDGVGALWSEIKQTAPLQRTSAHLCDVKSKLINKGLSLSRGPCHPIQGVEASHFHQRRSPTWVNSHLATTQLSLFWRRSHSYSGYKKKGLSGSRRALHSRNQSPFQIFALVREKLRLLWKEWVSVPLQRERETGTERLKWAWWWWCVFWRQLKDLRPLQQEGKRQKTWNNLLEKLSDSNYRPLKLQIKPHDLHLDCR